MKMKILVSNSIKFLFLIIILTIITSCKSGTNIDIPGVTGPNVSLQKDNIIISVSIKNFEVSNSAKLSFPKLKNSYLDIKQNALKGASLKFVLSLSDLLGDLSILNPKYLPGGRNLPGVPSGHLAATALTINKLKNITLYLGKTIFGVFIPLNLKIDNSIVSFKYYIGGRRSGNLSLVGRDSAGENSGLLLLLDLKRSTRSRLKKVIRKYLKIK